MKISQGVQDIALVSHWPMLPAAAATAAAAAAAAATAATPPHPPVCPSMPLACQPAQCHGCLHNSGAPAAAVAPACLQSQYTAVQL